MRKEHPEVIPYADPLKLIKLLWPSVTLYKEQRDILYSVEECPETIVPAANQMGKDFVSALITLVFFIRRKSARIVTTSVDFNQLEKVLWGEMANFIATSEYKLPIRVKHMEIKRIHNGKESPKAYLIGRTATDQASLQGHHHARDNGRPTTLAVYDEASGIAPDMFQATAAWRHSMLVIGNCFPCRNYFYTSTKEGSIFDPTDETRLLRNVIQIKASQSPNVRFAEAQVETGQQVTHEELIPGVVSYRDVITRRATWTPMAQAIGLDAEFYDGAEVKHYPTDRIDLSAKRAIKNTDDIPTSMGIDPAAGRDGSSFAICSDSKLLLLESKRTTDTQEIVDKAISHIKRYSLDASSVGIDAGGGGLQIAHQLRRKGYNIRTVNFGGAFKPPKASKLRSKKQQEQEKAYVYVNIRAFLFHLLSLRLDVSSGFPLFDIPIKYLRYCLDDSKATLREKMEPVP